jgi:hypothetical protein
MGYQNLRVLLASAVLCCPVAGYAHHSFAANWDTAKSFTISGTLEKIDWINPHSFVHVQALTPDGKQLEYSFEGFPPAMLRHQGVFKDDFASRVGRKVTVTAYTAKDGTGTLGFGRYYKFDDGTTIVMVRDASEINKQLQ